MPIRPEMRDRYPENWKEIRARLLERAGHRCEGTWMHPDCRAINHQPHPETGSMVVLTIAHWPDPTPENCADGNLRALCQRCHLALDRSHHVEMARRTRERRAGVIRLPGFENYEEG